ncbi:M15 family metallopeptidase [Streptomyces guryensis]|uniref:M15 family metallopeptidase n=1 Tax=Streptomyces guryensis TaxID=2886947 RepID=A0A9Q3VNW5_9ACTN|nr:M15 family metallopeptidase [Streptomyces guryensis]MCD9874969.1 M15 family metallopeptidase [Streptomyces guryensis]
MTRTPPSAHATSRRRIYRPLVVGPVVVIAVIAAAFGYQVRKSSSSSSLSPRSAALPSGAQSSEHSGALGEADGVVPDGVTLFDDAVPAVAKLDPGLLKALRRAATAAADDGVRFYVNSGWRSREYQNQLLRRAVAEYGSENEAARWVATAVTSPHVSGNAVDLGHPDATAWLSEHGAEYGLCQIYRNEPWHYELRPSAIDRGCPPMYADPTEDPRMQR